MKRGCLELLSVFTGCVCVCACARVRPYVRICGNAGWMDQLEERDPPQSWPRAESRIMNRALRLLLGEKKAGME